MIKIILVEDHKIVRDGIRTLLGKELDIDVISEAGTGREALAILENLETDIVLTDINMPDLDGIALSGVIRRRYPHIRIIILSMLDQPDYILKAFKNGVQGYILKNVSQDELIFAIRHIFTRQERYICSELALRMLDKLIHASDESLATYIDFTRREIEVLELIAGGLTNQEIADKLFTSRRTVEGHRQSLMDKTGSRNSAALIRYAMLNGIIT